MIDLTDIEARRYWAKVQKTEDCWLWVGSLDSRGYGQIWHRGRGVRAHHIMSGWPPEGMEVDHLCRVRNCVNPTHLELVTKGENIRRGTAWHHFRVEAQAVTHCPRGHEYTTENTYLQQKKTGTLMRSCIICRRARGRVHSA